MFESKISSEDASATSVRPFTTMAHSWRHQIWMEVLHHRFKQYLIVCEGWGLSLAITGITGI